MMGQEMRLIAPLIFMELRSFLHDGYCVKWETFASPDTIRERADQKLSELKEKWGDESVPFDLQLRCNWRNE